MAKVLSDKQAVPLEDVVLVQAFLLEAQFSTISDNYQRFSTELHRAVGQSGREDC